jgi:hypothetical protein
MKLSGFRKLLLLSLATLSLAAHAQLKMKYPAATFDAGEAEPGGVTAPLNSSHAIREGYNNNAPAAAPAPTSGPVSEETPGSITITPAATETSPPPSEPAPAPNPEPAPAAAPMAESAPPAENHTPYTPPTSPSSTSEPAPSSEPVTTESRQISTSMMAPKVPERVSFDSQAHWRIQSGDRLSDVFTRWAQSVGWQVAWETTDMVAQADLELDDTFTGAVTKVAEALNRSGSDLQVKFYTANHMLRVMARK